MTALALLAAIAAFAAFALQTDRHHRRWFGGFVTRPGKRLLRGIGVGALLLAFPLAVAARGWIYGPIAWFGLIMLAAGATFLFLNLAPAPAERTSR